MRPARFELTTFGFESTNDISAADFRSNREGSFFVLRSDDRDLGEFHVPIPGRHIVLNALACVATCRALGLSVEEIARGLKSFTGAARRWQDVFLRERIRNWPDNAPDKPRGACYTSLDRWHRFDVVTAML